VAFDHDFDVDQIRESLTPMLLPANRVIGDDGIQVSARETCEATGVDLEQLERLQRAVGLPRIDDPDSAVLLRADGAAAAAGAKIFLDVGFDPDVGIHRAGTGRGPGSRSRGDASGGSQNRAAARSHRGAASAGV
jgi:adenylate cyclase